MAISLATAFGGGANYYKVSNAAPLNLPASNWCIGIWTRITVAPTGTYMYAYSFADDSSTAGDRPQYGLYLNHNTDASQRTWSWLQYNTGQVPNSIISPAVVGNDGLDRLIIVQFNNATKVQQLWFSGPAGAALQGSVSLGSRDYSFSSSSSHLNIGAYPDSSVWFRRMTGDLGGFFKGNFVLSQEEITALGRGYPLLAMNKPLVMYLPFTAAPATQRDLIGSNDMTKFGTANVGQHFPQMEQVSAVVAAAGLAASKIPQMSDHYRRLRS